MLTMICLNMSCGCTEMYPEDWDQIAEHRKDLAEWHCEKCGHVHDPKTGHVLTVHHLDGDTNNSADDNLVAVCQRCHLQLQPKAVAVRHGQISLF